MLMSSIMRRRNGLMTSADWRSWEAPVLRLECFNPSIVKPASRLVIPQRLNCSSALAQLSTSRAARSRGSGFVLWPFATGDALTARRRFRGIADMKRFSTPNDLSRMARSGHRRPNDLFRLDVGRPDHFAPLLSFVRQEFAEVGRRRRHWHATQYGKALFHLGVGQTSVYLSIELLDDLGRGARGRSEAVPVVRLEPRNCLGNRSHIGQRLAAPRS